jgi:hypothetical protein
VRITVSPIAGHRSEAIAAIDAHFNHTHAGKLAAYAAKRAAALRAVERDEITPEFEAAASVEGMSAAAFARLIRSKPDASLTLETERRRAVLAVRAAASIDEIKAIVAAYTASGAFL